MSALYPWYVTTESDRRLMETKCRWELESWRMAMGWRSQLRGLTAKLKFRNLLEQAFDHLQIAFAAAKAPAKVAELAA